MPATSGAPRGCVLVVDDELEIGCALARELRCEFDVVVTERPAAALNALAHTANVCAVVSDLHMDGHSGLDLLREVRRRIAGCARVLVSAGISVGDADWIVDAGIADQVIAKPWRQGEIVEAIRRALVARDA